MDEAGRCSIASLPIINRYASSKIQNISLRNLSVVLDGPPPSRHPCRTTSSQSSKGESFSSSSSDVPVASFSMGDPLCSHARKIEMIPEEGQACRRAVRSQAPSHGRQQEQSDVAIGGGKEQFYENNLTKEEKKAFAAKKREEKKKAKLRAKGLLKEDNEATEGGKGNAAVNQALANALMSKRRDGNEKRSPVLCG